MNAEENQIEIRGARAHNLQGIDLDLPRGGFIVFTGVSGSGKSSLAIDTIFAEGQRRYLEGLAPGARRLLEELPRPPVERLDGLPPTLCVGQLDRVAGNSPRATIATLTEIHDFLRLLFARCGEVHCPSCGRALACCSVEQIVSAAASLPEGSRLHVLAPLVRRQSGDHRDVFLKIRREGFVRARVNGAITLIDGPLPLDPGQSHDIDMVVDRQVVRPGIEDRLADSIQTALRHGESVVILAGEEDGEWRDRVYSTRPVCLECGIRFPSLEPRHFHFNSPHGACPSCQGLGFIEPAANGAAPPGGAGDAAEPPPERHPRVCPDCQGARVDRLARSVQVGGMAIHEVTRLPVAAAMEWIGAWRFPSDRAVVAEPIARQLRSRLEFLVRAGVGYLELDRPLGTLSGGELQRIRLAGCVGSGLCGVAYVLDEPTVGLHPRDTQALLGLLEELRGQDNTLLVVEHDEETIRRADWIVDIGPGAGPEGGRIVHQGPPRTFPEGPGLTADYLAGRRAVVAPGSPAAAPADWLVVEGAREHNLKGIDARFPFERFIVVTGVSGSGKSTLLLDILVPAILRHLGRVGPEPGEHARIIGVENVRDLVLVDSSPIGRTPRSSPATYLGVLDPIRQVFARTRLARALGYGAARFSPNAAAGRCPHCQGLGAARIDLVFLPDLFAPCPLCNGRRFNRATLEATFKEKSIADVLDMTIAEAASFFENHPRVAGPLAAAEEVGLGYLRLGQWATTLSGGEAQRLRLAERLARPRQPGTVFVLDEPTTGLHPHDIAQLLGVLKRLVDRGSTVMVIEHHREVIASADWIVDLGPEGGEGGGRIVAEGPPASIAACPRSHTGRALMGRLDPRGEDSASERRSP